MGSFTERWWSKLADWNLTGIAKHGWHGANGMKLTQQEALGVITSARLKKLKSKLEFSKLWYDDMGLDSMSDINGPFSAGCTGAEPHCRMVVGAVSQDYALVIYEQGGIIYFRKLKLYKHGSNGVDCVYTETVNHERIGEIEGKLTD